MMNVPIYQVGAEFDPKFTKSRSGLRCHDSQKHSQKHKSPGWRGFDAIEVISLRWCHVDGVLVQSALDGKGNLPANQRKQSVVFADTDIDARVELGTALANNDAACVDHFPAELLDTQHFWL